MSKSKIKLGGIWKNVSESGNVYYSGNISKYLKVLIMPNSYKEEGGTQPDFNIYLADNIKEDAKLLETTTEVEAETADTL